MRFVCVLDDEEDGVWSFFGREENVVYIGATSGGLKVAWAGNGGAGGFEVDEASASASGGSPSTVAIVQQPTAPARHEEQEMPFMNPLLPDQPEQVRSLSRYFVAGLNEHS